MPRVQFVLLVFAALLTRTTSVDTSYRIWCYTGLKYFIGQEEKQDAEECFSFFGMKNYCYKFVASTPVQDVIKLGCSSFICSVSFIHAEFKKYPFFRDYGTHVPKWNTQGLTELCAAVMTRVIVTPLILRQS